MSFSQTSLFPQDLKIITVDSSEKQILIAPTEDFKESELLLAREIAEKLFLAIDPYLPAAGLAAPQIGLSRSIFIYSYDRDPKNLEVVINPNFMPMDDKICERWEGCFSVILSEGTWVLAKIPRYEKIKAIYLNQEGERVEKVLEGFAAKVFQHEWDHLQGTVNIYRKDAITQQFSTREELFNFMQAVKKEDSRHYKNPAQ